MDVPAVYGSAYRSVCLAVRIVVLLAKLIFYLSELFFQIFSLIRRCSAELPCELFLSGSELF